MDRWEFNELLESCWNLIHFSQATQADISMDVGPYHLDTSKEDGHVGYCLEMRDDGIYLLEWNAQEKEWKTLTEILTLPFLQFGINWKLDKNRAWIGE